MGLDSDERDNPPVKFARVFERARAEGYRLTMHCDVDQADAVGHIWQCLDDIGVERIDHGVNCLEDGALVARLGRDGIGLTVCPVSNRWVTDGLKAVELKIMLDRSLRATVNSDDPAYFSAYVNQNLAAAQEAVGLDRGRAGPAGPQLLRDRLDQPGRPGPLPGRARRLRPPGTDVAALGRSPCGAAHRGMGRLRPPHIGKMSIASALARRSNQVTDGPSVSSPKPKIDTTVAHTARIWNYWLGGKDNYPVEEERERNSGAREPNRERPSLT